MSEPLEPRSGTSMLSAEDSRVRTLAMPVAVPESTASDLGSGEKSSAWFANYDPATSLWRTSQRCLDGEWAEWSGTWPRAGMTRNGTAYQRSPLVPLTSAIAYGLWPTPEASNSAAGDARKAIYFLPSGRPRGLSNSGIDGSIGLARMARLFPTPTAGDAKSARNSTARRRVLPPSGVHAGDTLTDAVVPQRGALNPMWVEWLMGYPLGWTECGDSATASSRKLRNGSSVASKKPRKKRPHNPDADSAEILSHESGKAMTSARKELIGEGSEGGR
jgi:hypothetical protein